MRAWDEGGGTGPQVPRLACVSQAQADSRAIASQGSFKVELAGRWGGWAEPSQHPWLPRERDWHGSHVGRATKLGTAA